MHKYCYKRWLWIILSISQSPEQSQFKAKSFCAIAALLLFPGAGILGAESRGTAPLGDLKIEGEYIERLLLRRNDGHSEVFADPTGTVRLPSGQYLMQEIRLKGGYNHRTMPRNSQITITADEPALLKVGGPLKRTINVRRQGRMLELTYALAGIGGETYAAVRNANKAPSFAIYKGDRKIADGEFEFG